MYATASPPRQEPRINPPAIKLLQIFPILPYPPRTGGRLRAWNLCSRLSSRIDQTVLCRTEHPPAPENLAPFAARQVRLHALYIPRPRPAVRLLKGLRFLLSPYPVMLAGWDHRLMRRRLAELLRSDDFDLVVVDGSPLCVYMPVLRRCRALKVVHLYDLEAEFLLRQARVMPPGPRKLMALLDAARMQRAEERMLREADLIMVTSERERAILLKQNPRCSIAIVSNGVDCRVCRPLPVDGGREILYIGSLQYPPNVDAVLYFAAEVWPALHARFPDLVFRVVGRCPSEELRRLQGSGGVCMTGEVDDVEPYYRRAALCVVPLRAGGGTRLKILEAFAYGRPVVSTTLGCEGLDAVDGAHLLVADKPADMHAQIARVLTEPDLARDLCANGRALVENRYSWDRIAADLYGVYERLVAEKSVIGNR